MATANQYLIGYDAASPQRKAFLKATGRKGLKLWGNNKPARRSWFAHTVDLIDRGAHLLQNGAFASNTPNRLP